MENVVFIAHWMGEPVEMVQVGGLMVMSYAIGLATANAFRRGIARIRGRGQERGTI